MHIHRRASSLLLTLSLLAASHALAQPMPEFYGTYAVDKQRLFELKADATKWPDVGSDVRFIIFDKAVGYGTGQMAVRRLGYLRAIIDPDAEVEKTDERKWFVKDEQSRVTQLRAKPVSGQAEMVMLVPSESLADGAYVIQRGSDNLGWFYVGQSKVFARIENSEDCFDRVYRSMGAKNDSSKVQFVNIQAWGDRFGGGRLVPCAESDVAAAEAKLNASASSQPEPSDDTHSAAYKNCIAVGNRQEFCAKTYPATSSNNEAGTRPESTPQSAGAASAADQNSAAEALPPIPADVLSAQLAELMRRGEGASRGSAKNHVLRKAGVSFSAPGDLELYNASPPIVTIIAAPGAKSWDDWTHIFLTKARAPAQVSVDLSTQKTIEDARPTLSNPSLAGPVPTTMAGAEARVFFLAGIRNGRTVQIAVTVAVVGNQVLGAVLHATPESFESAWDDYQQVVRSYVIQR